MGYFTTANVNEWMPAADVVGSGTTPNTTTVDGWCLLVSSQIDVAREAAGFATPSIDANEVNLYKLRGSRETAYQVKAARGAATGEKISPLYLGWHREFEEMLSKQAAGTLTAASSEDVPWSFTRDADPTDMSDDRNPIFIRDYEP